MTSLADRQLEAWKARMAPLGRLPKEWLGKTPESMPPPRIRDRILRGFGGKCARSGLPITGTFICDHVIPLADGGLNCERNLQPLLDDENKRKTREEAKARARADRARRARNGTKTAPTTKLKGAPFALAPPQAKATTPVEKKAPESNTSNKFGFLERRPMFVNEDQS
jgi:hypothetical protein